MFCETPCAFSVKCAFSVVTVLTCSTFAEAILYNHPNAIVAQVQAEMGKFLKMASYRQGGTDAGASLSEVSSQSPSHLLNDVDDAEV